MGSSSLVSLSSGARGTTRGSTNNALMSSNMNIYSDPTRSHCPPSPAPDELGARVRREPAEPKTRPHDLEVAVERHEVGLELVLSSATLTDQRTRSVSVRNRSISPRSQSSVSRRVAESGIAVVSLREEGELTPRRAHGAAVGLDELGVQEKLGSAESRRGRTCCRLGPRSLLMVGGEDVGGQLGLCLPPPQCQTSCCGGIKSGNLKVGEK